MIPQSPKSSSAMRQLKTQLGEQATTKVLFCGKLRIDCDNVADYLKTGRVIKRQQFFDAWPDRHNFNTVQHMQDLFRDYCNSSKRSK